MPNCELKEGRYLRLVGGANPPDFTNKFWKVMAVEPVIYETGTSDTAEFVAVATTASSGFRNIDVIEPDDSPRHLYYFRWGVKDGCYYQIKIPTGSDRLGTDQDMDVARIDNTKSPYYAPNDDYGFFLMHDMYPAINAVNITPITLTPKVWFEGEKFAIDEVKDVTVIQKLNNSDVGVTPFIPYIRVTLGGLNR